MRRTRLLDTAGILVIISSGYALFNSLVHLSNITSAVSIGAPWTYRYEPLLPWLIIINAFVFPLGLASGILALLRKNFGITTIGVTIMLLSHVLSTILPLLKYPYYLSLGWSLMWGTPMVLASGLGLIITIRNREAFS